MGNINTVGPNEALVVSGMLYYFYLYQFNMNLFNLIN